MMMMDCTTQGKGAIYMYARSLGTDVTTIELQTKTPILSIAAKTFFNQASHSLWPLASLSRGCRRAARRDTSTAIPRLSDLFPATFTHAISEMLPSRRE